MPTVLGLEGRFADHLTRSVKTTDKTLKQSDKARDVAAKYKEALAVIKNQSESVETLFETSKRSVKLLHDFQQASGIKQVRLIPLPTKTIIGSKGQQLGYINLSIEFMASVLVSCLDEILELNDESNRKDNIISQVAGNDDDLLMIGALQELSIGDLESDAPVTTSKTDLESDDDFDEEADEDTA